MDEGCAVFIPFGHGADDCGEEHVACFGLAAVEGGLDVGEGADGADAGVLEGTQAGQGGVGVLAVGDEGGVVDLTEDDVRNGEAVRAAHAAHDGPGLDGEVDGEALATHRRADDQVRDERAVAGVVVLEHDAAQQRAAGAVARVEGHEEVESAAALVGAEVVVAWGAGRRGGWGRWRGRRRVGGRGGSGSVGILRVDRSMLGGVRVLRRWGSWAA